MNAKSLRVGLAVAIFATFQISPAAASEFVVTGTIHETFFQFAVAGPRGIAASARDTITGDLAGEGKLHIFNTEIVDPSIPIVSNVISTRQISTAEGLLFLSEVGSRNGDEVNVLSTVTGGTGAFKGATGELVISGIHTTETTVDFEYAGIINLP